MTAPVAAVYFASPGEFRAWLAEHHTTATEVLVGFWKAGTGRPSLTWPEAVDQALCYGWIDGIRRRVDDERYTIRFTPRRGGSTWSAVNVAKVEALTAAGLMTPAGAAAWEARDPARTGGTYSFERAVALSEEYDARLRAHPDAAAYWDAQPPSYRKTIAHWVMSAKREETRLRRLAALAAACAEGRRL